MGYLIPMWPPIKCNPETSRRTLPRERLGLAFLIVVYFVICCVSSAFTSQLYSAFNLFYDSTRLPSAALVVAVFAAVLLLFLTFSEFSFGYFVGFYFSSMVVGYLWFNFFSDLDYNRVLAGLSAAISLVVFLLPALGISSPIRQIFTMSPRAFERLLMLVLLLCLVTGAVGAGYNFKFVLPAEVSNLRGDPFPRNLNYLIAITSSALLPFLFACFVERKDHWRAGAVLVVLLLYYPVAETKTTLFTPAWLVFMVLLSRIFAARQAVVVSLLLPMLAGVGLIILLMNDVVSSSAAVSYFYTVNFRVIAIPSIAMDIYNDFFSRHEVTHFCQIRLLKLIIGCPYQDQLSVVMLNNYPFGGNFNASLFATEGIASLGSLFAPVSVFAAGLVVALGNRLSAGLPPSFILVSSAVLPQTLLNVPLSTVLLTHGAGLLFLLWYITPRGMFEQNAGRTLKVVEGR
jgi:hypothetical protein